MGTITHNTVATGTNDGTKQVSKDAWNEGHSISLDKTDVGLTNVDNTSDADKPVSAAVSTALALKAPITSAVLVTPALGTIQSGNLAAGTGYTVSALAGAGAGVLTFLATPSSANLASAVTGETGSGGLVFATSATLVTPALGTIQSGNLAAGTGYTITNVAGMAANVGAFLISATSASLLAAMTNETGTGALVFGTSATLVTPALGTPQSGVLTNCTGYTPANITTLATGMAAFMVSGTSASFLGALSDETGSGVNVFNITASLVAPTADRYTVSAGNTYTVTATTYTAAAADNGRVGRFSVTCVISLNTGLPAGWWGAFRATTSAPFTITGSATVQSPNGRTSRAQWSEIVAKYDATDVYVLSGDSKT